RGLLGGGDDTRPAQFVELLSQPCGLLAYARVVRGAEAFKRSAKRRHEVGRVREWHFVLTAIESEVEITRQRARRRDGAPVQYDRQSRIAAERLAAYGARKVGLAEVELERADAADRIHGKGSAACAAKRGDSGEVVQHPGRSLAVREPQPRCALLHLALELAAIEGLAPGLAVDVELQPPAARVI